MIEANIRYVKNGEEVLLEGLSFVMEGKGIHGVLGPVGSGKSALARTLMGDLIPTEGELLLNGEGTEEGRADLLLARKRKIGYMPTDLSFYEDMTLLELLFFVGGVKEVESERLFRQSMEALRLVELEDYAQCLIGRLGAADKRRFAIAVSLIGNPEWLILDEPTSGLSAGAAEEIRNLVELLGTKKSILLCTRLPKEAEALCYDLLLLSRGKQVLFDTVENLRRRLAQTELLTITVRASKEGAEALCEPIRSLWGVESCKAMGAAANGGYTLQIEAKPTSDRKGQLQTLLSEQGTTLMTFERVTLTIEDAFLALTEPCPVSDEPKKSSRRSRADRKEAKA